MLFNSKELKTNNTLEQEYWRIDQFMDWPYKKTMAGLKVVIDGCMVSFGEQNYMTNEKRLCLVELRIQQRLGIQLEDYPISIVDNLITVPIGVPPEMWIRYRKMLKIIRLYTNN